jgi:hypothetical protein
MRKHLLQIYKMPKEAVQEQKRAILAASLTLFIGVPLLTVAAGTFFHLDRSTLTTRDLWSIGSMLGLPCMLLWLYANMMKSFQIQLEDDRIARVQNHPFGHSTLKISIARQDVGHIREVPKSGLYLHGRNGDGRWIDLQIPRTLEDYEGPPLPPRCVVSHPRLLAIANLGQTDLVDIAIREAQSSLQSAKTTSQLFHSC